MITSTTRPKYMFCWWCSRHLQGRFHVTMRGTGASENASPVTVHRVCAEHMERQGDWESVPVDSAA